MNLKTVDISLKTNGNFQIFDITEKIQENLNRTKLQEGHVLLFVSGSTAGLTTVEFEPGLVKDLEDFFDRIAPEGIPYQHEEMWHDGNGHSHIRSSLLKPSFQVPFQKGELMLGTWQQVIFVEFDNKPRTRKVIMQFTGI